MLCLFGRNLVLQCLHSLFQRSRWAGFIIATSVVLRRWPWSNVGDIPPSWPDFHALSIYPQAQVNGVR